MDIDHDHNKPNPLPIAPGVAATAPFSARPPSPPYIHVPTVTHRGQGTTSMSITPSFTDIDSTQLTEADLRLITSGGALQSATDSSNTWKYESRRQAQPILDFLYLGPSSVTKDFKFLTNSGITLILAIRDARFGGMTFMNCKRAGEALGVEVDNVDILPDNGPQDVMRGFGLTVKKINEHLLRVFRESEGQKKGKVLICCETGNDRSALMGAAYIMTVFGVDLVTTIQFMTLQRFCVTFGDDVKFLLQTYDDILRARRDVSRARGERLGGEEGSLRAQIKRRVGEMGPGMVRGEDDDDDDEGMGVDGNGDKERFEERKGFMPYVDSRR
ncbi:putative fmi2 protein [Podospora fimiseda]|uniref:Fmi2 protein n=1 Tax=Podospora fimiseda TaxID=252190 RepID=A0AAN7BSQ3_9PEZI|nr:putative fmi2 protein [Podospora fimiseda]